MTWLSIAILAYFILALVNVADKFILEKVVPSPRTYTFLVGITGVVVLAIAPLGIFWPNLKLVWPGGGMLMLNFLVGFCFSAGLFFMYYSLKKGEASKVFTILGGLVPIFTVIFSLLFLQERFDIDNWLAIFFLILGTIVISSISPSHHVWTNMKTWFANERGSRKVVIGSAVIASFFYALFWVGTKFAYDTQPFMSAFIWIRVGIFLSALLLLISKDNRRHIFGELKKSKKKKNNSFVFFGTQALGATGALLQNYAVLIGSVALVTSLQGVQYAFLMILILIGTIFMPKVIKEKISVKILSQKFLAIALIAIGLYFIARP